MKSKTASKIVRLVSLALYATAVLFSYFPHEHSAKAFTSDRCLLCQWNQTAKADGSKIVLANSPAPVEFLPIFFYESPSLETFLKSFTDRSPPSLA